jgi:hypothetical protein
MRDTDDFEEDLEINCLEVDSFDKCKKYLSKCIPVPSYISGIPCIDCSSYENIDCGYLFTEDLCNQKMNLCKVSLNCGWFKGRCVDKNKICSYFDEEECYNNLHRCVPSFDLTNIYLGSGVTKQRYFFDSCKLCEEGEELLDCNLFSKEFCEKLREGSQICGRDLRCEGEYTPDEEKIGICKNFFVDKF